MNKSELVGNVAARTALSRTDAASLVDAVFEAVTEALGRREEVRIAGFGLFATRERPARTARNPRTGAPVAVEASTATGVQAGQGAARYCEQRRLVVSLVKPGSRSFVVCRG